MLLRALLAYACVKLLWSYNGTVWYAMEGLAKGASAVASAATNTRLDIGASGGTWLLLLVALYALAASEGVPAAPRARRVAAWGWGGAAVAALLCGSVQAALWHVPTPSGQMVNCCFEGTLSDADFRMHTPTASLVAREGDEYQTMLVWAQRLGWVSFVGHDIAQDARSCDVLVVVNPSRAPTAAAAASLLGYVEGGGRLVVVTGAAERPDGRRERQKAADRLLAPFGLSVQVTPRGDKELKAPGDASSRVWPALKPCEARGGRALLLDSRKRPALAVARHGQGAVAVFTDSGLFADASIGTVWSTPTPRQVRISHLLYYVLQSADPERPAGRSGR